MLDLLEAGVDSDNWDIFSELAAPCFGASVLRMEVSESNFCLQLQFEYQASGPLVQNYSPAKSVLNVTTTFDLVFSSDRSSDRFTGKPVSQTTGYITTAKTGTSHRRNVHAVKRLAFGGQVTSEPLVKGY